MAEVGDELGEDGRARLERLQHQFADALPRKLLGLRDLVDMAMRFKSPAGGCCPERGRQLGPRSIGPPTTPPRPPPL